MSAEAPVIGVTGPEEGGWVAWRMTARAVRLAGGKPLRITASHPAGIDDLDGLILGGGSDVDPGLYGQEPEEVIREIRLEKERLKRYLISFLTLPLLYLFRKAFSTSFHGPDPARDELEHGLLEAAVQREMPILGICRGAQLINVYFGGSLHQDIAQFYQEVANIRSVLPKKKIQIKMGSKLSSILKDHSCTVNALHHQAVDKVGENLVLSAWETNQVVQGIEHATLPFVLGVQWHPEYLPHVPRQRALFRALVRAAQVWAGCPAEEAPGDFSLENRGLT